MIGCLSARLGLASSVRTAWQVEASRVLQPLLLVDFQACSVRAACQVVGGDILIRLLGKLTIGRPDGQKRFFLCSVKHLWQNHTIGFKTLHGKHLNQQQSSKFSQPPFQVAGMKVGMRGFKGLGQQAKPILAHLLTS